MVADLKAKHGYKTVVMVGDGATDMEARDIPGGADAFLGFGGIAVREKVTTPTAWTLTWTRTQRALHAPAPAVFTAHCMPLG